jgi:hypothetical protein
MAKARAKPLFKKKTLFPSTFVPYLGTAEDRKTAIVWLRQRPLTRNRILFCARLAAALAAWRLHPETAAAAAYLGLTTVSLRAWLRSATEEAWADETSAHVAAVMADLALQREVGKVFNFLYSGLEFLHSGVAR